MHVIDYTSLLSYGLLFFIVLIIYCLTNVLYFCLSFIYSFSILLLHGAFLFFIVDFPFGWLYVLVIFYLCSTSFSGMHLTSILNVCNINFDVRVSCVWELLSILLGIKMWLFILFSPITWLPLHNFLQSKPEVSTITALDTLILTSALNNHFCRLNKPTTKDLSFIISKESKPPLLFTRHKLL